MVIPSVAWMKTSDPEILRFFNGHERVFVATPSVVAANCPLSQTHARRRMSELHSAGFLEQPKEIEKRGYYQITERGRRYLRGEYTKSELEDLEPE